VKEPVIAKQNSSAHNKPPRFLIYLDFSTEILKSQLKKSFFHFCVDILRKSGKIPLVKL
jgi:hypothetical protein